MGETRENVEIRLDARANLKGAADMVSGLKGVDSAAAKATESLKKTEQQAEKANQSIIRLASSKDLQRAIASNPTLARLNPSLSGGGTVPPIPPASAGPTPTAPPPSEGSAESSIAPTGMLGGWIKQLIGYLAVIKTVRAAIHNYVEDERAQASLDAALAQRAQLTDKYRESLQGLADTLGRRTAIQGSQWMDVLTTLTKFGADSGTIEKAAQAVEDLAGATGGSLAEAAVSVGKAMQGNFTMLTRYGFKVDETKTKTEQLNSLFEQFAQRGAGQLEARSKTLSGQFATMTNALGNLGSAITNATAKSGALQFWFDAIAKAANKMADSIGSSIPRVEGLKNTLGETVGVLDETEDAANRTATATDKVAKAADRAADALARQKDAMREESNQTIRLIEANAKLEEARIRASNAPEAQKNAAIAALHLRTETAIFNERNRADANVIRVNRQAGLDMNQQLLDRDNAVEDKKAELERAKSAEALRADAARKRDAADTLRRQLKDGVGALYPELAAQPGRNHYPDEDLNLTQFLGGMTGNTITREEYNTALREQRKQMEKADAEATAAEQKSAGVGQPGNIQALQDEYNQLKAKYDVEKEKAEDLQQRLDRETEQSQRELRFRGQTYPVDQTTGRINAAADLSRAVGPQPATVNGQQNLLAAEYTALQTAFAAFAEANRAGQRETAQQIYGEIRALQQEIRMLRLRH